jgi:hypothetical protein
VEDVTSRRLVYNVSLGDRVVEPLLALGLILAALVSATGIKRLLPRIVHPRMRIWRWLLAAPLVGGTAWLLFATFLLIDWIPSGHGRLSVEAALQYLLATWLFGISVGLLALAAALRERAP